MEHRAVSRKCSRSHGSRNDPFLQDAWSSAAGTTFFTSTTSGLITTDYNDNRTTSMSGAYWGCCKPSCAWPGKIPGGGQARSCAKDGMTAVNPNNASVCDNGTAHMCTDQQPWNVSQTLSYGYAGANIIVSLFFIEITYELLSLFRV